MDTQHPDLHPLFAEHIATLETRTDKALLRGGFDHLVVAAGQPAFLFLACEDASYMSGQVLHPNGGTIVNG
jgi:Xaa-Pro dipeptidase